MQYPCAAEHLRQIIILNFKNHKTMTVEELLNPRWKVMADYPNSPFNVGDIHSFMFAATAKIVFGTWPHLFRELQWWEEREEKDLPKYVKHKERDEVLKVERIEVASHYTNIISKDLKYGSTKYLSMYLPATEQEHTKYLADNKHQSQIEELKCGKGQKIA
jgi:hypothetical protein